MNKDREPMGQSPEVSEETVELNLVISQEISNQLDYIIDGSNMSRENAIQVLIFQAYWKRRFEEEDNKARIKNGGETPEEVGKRAAAIALSHVRPVKPGRI